MPGLVVQFHLDQNVPGEELAGRSATFTVLELNNGLGGNQDLAEFILDAKPPDPLFEVQLNLVFEARIGMDPIPAHCHIDYLASL